MLSRLPIIQAPIGSAAGVDLCVALCEAGALGSISLTWKSREQAREQIRAIKSRTNAPFMVNFVLHFDPVCLPVAIEERVPVISFSWGDPAPYVEGVHSAGLTFGIQVTSDESALAMLRHRPDFLIVQGTEAGGHVQARLTIWDALMQVIPVAAKTPVFAAGSITGGSDLNAVMELGAAGAVFGTRFLASVESEAHPEYKRAIVESKLGGSSLTTCFDGEWPQALHRVLRNDTFLAWENAGMPRHGQRPGEGEIVGRTAGGVEIARYDNAMPRFDTTGDVLQMALYAGSGSYRIRSIEPASDIVRQIAIDAGLELPA